MGGRPIFVVQRHQASTLHFDLRLEVDGVLVSWAVPKGPSLDPAVRRLAVRVGDHELSHATYEGRSLAATRVHTVVVWDTGSLENLTTTSHGEPVALPRALEAGHVKVALEGHKLGGAFALTRTAMNGDPRNWLLVKVADEAADPAAVLDDASVLSGLTNEDLAD